MRSLRVSVFGLRGQAGRHIRLLQDSPDAILDHVYYPKPTRQGDESLPVTATISDCLESDVIIISSPTPAHSEQLLELREYAGYILLEKPAVGTKREIRSLLALPASLKSRVQVNFNLLFHDFITELRRFMSGPMLGDVFALDVNINHGGAFRDDWSDSWRLTAGADLGPVETVGIHWVQFALSEFGRCLHAAVHVDTLSRRSQGIDTGMMTMQMESGPVLTIRTSYAAPFAVRVAVWGTNGYMSYDGQKAEVYSPRDTFDEHGLFTHPPIASEFQVDYQAAWQQSLARSQHSLLDAARSGKPLDPAAFDRDVAAMEVLLDAPRRARRPPIHETSASGQTGLAL